MTPPDTRLRRLAGSSGVYLIGTVIGQAAALVTFPLYARVLGPSGYGMLALITAFIGLGRTMLLGGVNTALIRQYVVASEEERATVLGSALGYGLIVSLAAIGVAVFGGAWLARALLGSAGQTGITLIRLAVLTLTLDLFVELLLALARSRELPRTFVLGTSARVVANVVLALVFLLVVPLGVKGAVASVLGANVIALLVLGLLQADVWRVSFDRRVAWTLVAFGLALVPANLASWVLNVIDRYMLQHMTSSSAVGLYSAAYRIGSLIGVAYVSPFHQAWIPHMLKDADQPDGPELIAKVARYFSAGGALAVVGIAAVGPEVLSLLAGERFMAAAVVIPIVAFGVFMSGAVTVFSPGIMLANRTWYSGLLFVLGAMLNIGMNALMIPSWGVLGAAIATFASYFVVAVGHVVVSQRFYPVPLRGAAFRWGFAATLTAVVALSVVAAVVPSGISALLLRIGIAFAFVAVLPFTRLVDHDEVSAVARTVRSTAGSALRRLGSRSPKAARIASAVRSTAKHVILAPAIIQAAMQNTGVIAPMSPSVDVCEENWMRGELLWSSAPPSEALVAAARRILAGERQVLSTTIVPGREHRWGTDQSVGVDWPLHYHKTIDLADWIDRADPKMPWELSRLHHLPVLAQAYSMSGDEVYAEYARKEIENWARGNPLGFGVNWCVAMEVGIRATNIAMAWQLLRTSRSWDSGWQTWLAELLAYHGDFVLRNLEDWGDRTQNHYVADIASLAVIGWSTGCFSTVETAAEGLRRCAIEQVNGDGVDFENSTSYHRLVTEMMMIGALACRAAGAEPGDVVWDTLASMCDYIDSYTRPDGTAPLVGDSDDGRMLKLADYFSWRSDEHAYILVLAERLFGRRYQSTQYSDSHWGDSFAIDKIVHDGAAESAGGVSRAFEQSGMYVLRTGSAHVFVNCARTGVNGLGPHRHNDALSYELWMGVPVAIDPGTFKYLSDTAGRRRYRSSRSHNVLVIDGAEQNSLDSIFGLESDQLVIRVLEWTTGPNADRIVASCSYDALREASVEWERTFDLDKRAGRFTVTDLLRGQGRHDVALRVQLPVGASPNPAQSGVGFDFATACMDIQAPGDCVATIAESRVSSSFGVEEPASAIEITGHQVQLPVKIVHSFSVKEPR